RVEAQRDGYFLLSLVELAELQQHVGQTCVRVAVRIIECDRPFRRRQGLGKRGIGVAGPTFLEFARLDEGQTSVCQGEIRVEFDRLPEKSGRYLARRGRVGGAIGTSLQHEVVGTCRVRRARSGMESARSLDAFGNARDHRLRYFVLDREDIIKTPVIAL